MYWDCLRLSPNLSDFLTGFYPIFQLETLLCVVPVSSIILGVNLCTVLVSQTCTSNSTIMMPIRTSPVYQYGSNMYQPSVPRWCKHGLDSQCTSGRRTIWAALVSQPPIVPKMITSCAEQQWSNIQLIIAVFWSIVNTRPSNWRFTITLTFGNVPKRVRIYTHLPWKWAVDCPSAQRQCGTITEQDTWVLVLPLWNSWVKLLKLVNLVKIWCEHTYIW